MIQNKKHASNVNHSTFVRVFMSQLLDFAKLIDHSFIDRKGNFLGFVELGNGPTVLLSAHLDTVEEIVEGREIIEENTVLWS
jgi:putative aminopeptidase FrvX